jgi:hypothetical protein
MSKTWALMAVGAGPDEGTSWLLAAGPREDVTLRARLARERYAGLRATNLSRWRIGALTFVPIDHPSLRNARRDVAITSLATLADRDRKAG